MKERLIKQIAALVFISSLLMSVLALVKPVLAAKVDPWGGQKSTVNSALGLGEKDPRAIIASVINVVLGFLGIIAVAMVFIGGFGMMTSGGNEDKAGTGKKMVMAGVIGLIIILATWGIATFVLDALLKATNTPTAMMPLA